MKPARKLLLERHSRICRFRQQIASQLLNCELIERQVAIKGVDDPLAPASHVSAVVDVIPVRVREPRRIEPIERHSLAVMRRLEQPINHLLVCVRIAIVQEVINLRDGRRQSRQIERDSPDQRLAIRFR